MLVERVESNVISNGILIDENNAFLVVDGEYAKMIGPDHVKIFTMHSTGQVRMRELYDGDAVPIWPLGSRRRGRQPKINFRILSLCCGLITLALYGCFKPLDEDHSIIRDTKIVTSGAKETLCLIQTTFVREADDFSRCFMKLTV